MYDFDEIIERKSDRCRKWDHQYVCSRFGDVPQDFIPLWIADMDFKSPPAVIERFTQVAQHGTFGYTWCFDEFYDAVIRFQAARHQVTVQPEWVTLSYGTVSTLHYLVQAFCQPGDCVMMNTPVYDPFAHAVTRQNVTVLTNPLVARDNRYHLDFDHIEAQMREHRPKVWLFCSPHNPSGRIWTAAEIKQVSDLCLQYGVLLVIDEVHAEHVLYGSFTGCLRPGCAAPENLILLTSPNKAFNLGGLKTSYSIIPDPALRAQFRRQLEKNSITSPNLFGVWGIIEAYNHGTDWLDELNRYLRGNADYLTQAVAAHFPDWQMMQPESSYLAWVNISATGRTATDLTLDYARRTGVVVEDGSHYVADGEEYLRINFGTPRALLAEAVNRLKNAR
ncbi:MalY/PatB family protein [Morganella morganii]|uniref:MalY/PatB family protein n=1 Tax=Morganella morganii TaxID=582 RepID=UPI001C41ACCC|nr:PatB family C-S lyase [Morganella morganii]ELA9087839.1 PatB family C-S lyase [Morganella morganii]MCU6226440.1 PatB family C-S lyase [Morganella morganii]MCU6231955.1 PatB family C-S lyase [Morganella morganii]MCU6378137.1 PatB family C-S lyase [Morganella morganii]HBH7052973.1 PatB family C-S lyase [Morganella morganii]